MLNLETGKIRVPLWVFVLCFFAITTATVGYWYFNIDEHNIRLLGLIGGIASGLVVYILTFVTLLRPIQELDRYRKMGVIDLLANRHDKNYYGSIIARAERDVFVMGTSCTRFIDDFLDLESDDKALVDALNKHPRLVVRLLIPADEYMSEEAKARAKSSRAKLSALIVRFGERVELRQFSDRARHSFVGVDDDLIAGPVFEGDKSKYAPAVHVARWTMFAQKYIGHFDDVWNENAPSR